MSEWKARRETRKLNARTDRAETYAADAIDFAVASIDEAAEGPVVLIEPRREKHVERGSSSRTAPGCRPEPTR